MFGYTGNEEITKGLLNAILKEKVTEVNLNCNTILERDLYDDKLGILDIRAKVNNVVDINVEMQLVDEKNIEKRITKIPYKMEHTRRNIWQNYIDRCVRVIYNWFIQDRKIFRKYIIRYLGKIY